MSAYKEKRREKDKYFFVCKQITKQWQQQQQQYQQNKVLENYSSVLMKNLNHIKLKKIFLKTFNASNHKMQFSIALH